jgi:arabinofuranan 3-O-arabinosyltransferase
VVDAAAAGLIAGAEAILYAADLEDGELAVLDPETVVVVTDSNRDRATHWRSSQDVTGFTEVGGPDADVTREDDADERLAVFGDQDPAHQTTARLEGDLVVRASSYGEDTAYRPEVRPAMAVDGDPRTAWIVDDRGLPIGESIEVSATDGRLVLLQPGGDRPNRVITRVRVEQPGRPELDVELTDASRVQPGQTVEVTPDLPVTITITEIADRPEGTDTGPSGVGFAELGPLAREVVRPPSDVLGTLPADAPLAIVLSRERVRDANRWRTDPEAALVRELELATPRTFDVRATVRLDRRAPDAVLNALAREPDAAIASQRLTGVATARGESAVDGNAATAWTTPFGEVVGSELVVPLDTVTPIGQLTLVQPTDELHSRITSIGVQVGTTDVVVDVPPPDEAGRSSVTFPAAAGDPLTVSILSIDPRVTRDRRYGELVQLPSSIIELEGIDGARRASPVDAAAACRSDLLTIDGRGVPLAVDADVLDRLLGGEAVDVGLCTEGARTVVLDAGARRVESLPGEETGIEVDRIVLTSGLPAPADRAERAQPAVDAGGDDTSRTATVTECPDGCWLILGEGYNSAWRARIVEGGSGGDASLGAPRQIAGGFNGWWLPPNDSPTTVRMTWPPQRGIDLALVLTAVAVLACVALIVWDRRRRDPALTPTAPAVAWPLPRASTRSALASAAVLVVVSGLAIAPLWAAIALVPALLVVLLRRPVVLGVGSAALAAVLGAIVVRRVLEHRYFLNAGWTSYFEDLHRPGMFVVVLLLAACIGHDGSVDSAEDRLPSSDAIATADSTTTTGSSGDRMRCAP